MHLLMNVLFETTPNVKQWPQFSSRRLLISIVGSLSVNCLAHFFDLIYSRHFLYSAVLTVPICISIYIGIDIIRLLCQILIPITYSQKSHFKLTIPWILFTFFMFHTFSKSSSSFIEEEHQLWYYLTPSILIYLTLQNFYNNVKKVWNGKNTIKILTSEMWNLRLTALVMIMIVFCRRLNQTGDKWRHLQDIGDILAKESNYLYLLITFLSGSYIYKLLLWKLYYRCMNLYLKLYSSYCGC